jgi:hypothetical protein
MLDGADSTAGAPEGGGGSVADADAAPMRTQATPAPAIASANLMRARRRTIRRIIRASLLEPLPAGRVF